MIIEHNSENPVVLGQTPVLLDFYATWCGPCRMFSEYLKQFNEKHPDFIIYKINVDEQPETAETYNVQSLPTIICINSDNEIWRHNGLMTLKQLEDKIYENI